MLVLSAVFSLDLGLVDDCLGFFLFEVVNLVGELLLSLNQLQKLVSSEKDTFDAVMGQEEATVVDFIQFVHSAVQTVEFITFVVAGISISHGVHAVLLFLLAFLVPFLGLLGVFFEVLNLAYFEHN